MKNVDLHIQPYMPEEDVPNELKITLKDFKKELFALGYNVELHAPPSDIYWFGPLLTVLIEISKLIAGAFLEIFFEGMIKKAKEDGNHLKISFRKLFRRISEHTRLQGTVLIKTTLDDCRITIDVKLKEKASNKEIETILNSFKYLEDYINEEKSLIAKSIYAQIIMEELIDQPSTEWTISIRRKDSRSELIFLSLNGKVLKHQIL